MSNPGYEELSYVMINWQTSTDWLRVISKMLLNGKKLISKWLFASQTYTQTGCAHSILSLRFENSQNSTNVSPVCFKLDYERRKDGEAGQLVGTDLKTSIFRSVKM